MKCCFNREQSGSPAISLKGPCTYPDYVDLTSEYFHQKEILINWIKLFFN